MLGFDACFDTARFDGANIFERLSFDARFDAAHVYGSISGSSASILYCLLVAWSLLRSMLGFDSCFDTTRVDGAKLLL